MRAEKRPLVRRAMIGGALLLLALLCGACLLAARHRGAPLLEAAPQAVAEVTVENLFTGTRASLTDPALLQSLLEGLEEVRVEPVDREAEPWFELRLLDGNGEALQTITVAGESLTAAEREVYRCVRGTVDTGYLLELTERFGTYCPLEVEPRDVYRVTILMGYPEFPAVTDLRDGETIARVVERLSGLRFVKKGALPHAMESADGEWYGVDVQIFCRDGIGAFRLQLGGDLEGDLLDDRGNYYRLESGVLSRDTADFLFQLALERGADWEELGS